MYINKVVVLGLTGLPSSGKGEFSKIASHNGFQEIIMGNVIREALVERDLEVNRENSDKIMIQLREEHGEDVVAQITLENIDEAINNGHNKILIDGIRSMDEVNTFREKFPELTIVAIHADPKTRYMRSKSRKRADDAYNITSFRKRDKIELSVGIGDVIALADILIVPPNNLESAQKMFQEVLEELNHTKKIGVVPDV